MNKRHSIFLILVLSLFIVLGYGWRIAGSGEYPKAGHKPQPKPSSPTPDKQTDFGFSCTLSINEISPRDIFTNTGQITVSYNLYLSSPLNVLTIPVKIGLFLDNQLKETSEINNFPNKGTRRLFISTPSPDRAKDYGLLVKVVRRDVDPARATGREIYAAASQIIHVNANVDLNLSGSEITISPNPPIRGEEFTIGVPLKNSGTDRVIDAEVAFMILSRDGVVIERVIHKAPVILGGQTFTYNCKFRISKLGTYQVRAVADPDGKIVELQENNNMVVYSFDVEAPESVVRFAPADGETGVDIWAKIEVEFDKDIGAASVEGSPTFRFKKSLSGKILTIKPEEPLKTNTRYTINIFVVGGHTHSVHFTTVAEQTGRFVFQAYGEAGIFGSGWNPCFSPTICFPHSESQVFVIGDYDGKCKIKYGSPYPYCDAAILKERFHDDPSGTYFSMMHNGYIKSAKFNVYQKRVVGNPYGDLGPFKILATIGGQDFGYQFSADSASGWKTIDITDYMKKLSDFVKSQSPSYIAFPKLEMRSNRFGDNDGNDDFAEFKYGNPFSPYIEVKFVPYGKYK